MPVESEVARRPGTGDDDDRRDVAQLRRDLLVDPGRALALAALPVLAGAKHDRLVGLVRAGEVDRVDARVRHQGLARLVAHARDDAHDAGRQHLERVRQRERRERRLVSGLDDHGVSRRQRRRHLPRHEQQRVVERHDGRHDPVGLLDREVHLVLEARRDAGAPGMTPELGVVVEARGHPLDLVQVLDHGLAALEGHDLRQLAMHGPDAGRDLVQQPRLVDSRHPTPCPLGVASPLHRPGDVRGLRARHLRQDLLRRGILDRHGLPAAGAVVLVIDPHPDRAHDPCLLRSPAPPDPVTGSGTSASVRGVCRYTKRTPLRR